MNKQDLLKVQTCVLRVNIHCDGCKQKVKKILQKVEGVYSVKIESEQGKVTVSGNADPAVLLKKLTKSGKHAELWGGNGQKGLSNNIQNQFNNQFMNMMQMGGKDGGKLHKGGGGDVGGGKDIMKGGSLPSQFKGLKVPSKDQKTVKFNLRDEHGEEDEDDYSDDEDYADEEDYTDDEGDGSEEEFDHKHPPPKMMPFMNGKGQGQIPGHGQAVNGMNMTMMNEKIKGKGGGGNGADMKALMMMLNEKKGEAGVHGGKGKKDKNTESDDELDGDSDFDMPIIKMGGKERKKGDEKHKDGKVMHSGGGLMKSLGGLFGGGQKKSKSGKGGGKFEKKGMGDHDHGHAHDHKHHGGNGGKTKGGSGGGGGNNGKMKDHGFIDNGHGKVDGGKITGSHGGFQNINVNQGGKGGGGGPKMGGHMGPISHMNMGHQGPLMVTFHPVQGLQAQGGMNPGYYNPGTGQGNPYNQQQQQYMAMMMNQQQQAGMHGAGEMYHPMMYARPHPAVNYANGYVPPIPPPSHANPHSHMFSDENTEGCSIM